MKPLKGYYPLYWYGMFYDYGYEVKAENTLEDIYSLCGVDKNGKTLSVITYYSPDDTAPDKTVKLNFGKTGIYEVWCLDDTHDAPYMSLTQDLIFTMKANTCILVKEK